MVMFRLHAYIPVQEYSALTLCVAKGLRVKQFVSIFHAMSTDTWWNLCTCILSNHQNVSPQRNTQELLTTWRKATQTARVCWEYSIKIKSSSRLRDTWDKREQRETKGHADYKYTREQVKTGRAGRQSDSWETHKEKRQVTWHEIRVTFQNKTGSCETSLNLMAYIYMYGQKTCLSQC